MEIEPNMIDTLYRIERARNVGGPHNRIVPARFPANIYSAKRY